MKLSDQEWKKIQRQLLKLEALEALEAGGVDNWEWYGESLKDWFKCNELDELVEAFINNLNDIIAEADISEPAGTGCGYYISFEEEFVSKLVLDFARDYKDIWEGD